MRELMGHSDQAAALGKLHLELDHARGKEALARAALNRSEMNRLELERVTRALRQDVTRLGAQLAIQQDRARWSEKVSGRWLYRRTMLMITCMSVKVVHSHQHPHQIDEFPGKQPILIT